MTVENLAGTDHYSISTERTYVYWARWYVRFHGLRHPKDMVMNALLRLTRTLELFKRESRTQPRVLALGLHPHLIGVPHRFGYFEEMLDLLMNTPGVCFMTGSQIADWYIAQAPAGSQ
jgi:hypothetical protein